MSRPHEEMFNLFNIYTCLNLFVPIALGYSIFGDLFFLVNFLHVSIKHCIFAADNLKVKNQMVQEYGIELIEEYENVNFYSIRMKDAELTELEAFFEKFPGGCEYDHDIDIIISWLDQIAERGALERYFRPEGRYGDGVGVIPIDVGNKIRLYCLRLSDKILVFGNGGVKDAKRWEESETLAPYVKMLIDTSRFIQSRINDGTIVLVDKEILGNLNFRRYEEE